MAFAGPHIAPSSLAHGLQTMEGSRPRTDSSPPGLTALGPSLSLIPVGLKEAALDSPTFRATVVHFAEQIDIVEKWLEGYVKSASKLSHEVASMESIVNIFLAHSIPPAQVSEAVLDHDYTLLAMKRYGEGAREFWSHTTRGMRRAETYVVEPIKSFLNNDLRNFKDQRKALEKSQKYYDECLSRYCSQAKTKEPSSIREDAFQLHEARKSYLKISMDLCVMAPQIKNTLDKLMIKVFSDQWKEMQRAEDSMSSASVKAGKEIERVRGWSNELEDGEKVFKRALMTARKQIEEAAEYSSRPSRELDDYTHSTVPYLGGRPSSRPLGTSPQKGVQERSEKQGWLFLRTITGKPSRTVWVRRWFYVKNGIFSYLVHNTRSGGVEESEKIGVLLCSVRPAFQEERRLCFEVKTKDTTITLQTETQSELLEWVTAFETAKKKAVENPDSTETATTVGSSAIDPAFAISSPVAPEFAARGESHLVHGSEDSAELTRSTTGLSVPDLGRDSDPFTRPSFEVRTPRRLTVGDRADGSERESGKDHAARIIQKLDLHRRTPASLSTSGAPPTSLVPGSGGIASLIAASHHIMPVGPGAPATAGPSKQADAASAPVPTSTLAPSTLVNPPAPTNLSKIAVVVSGERGIGLGQTDTTGGMPSGLMANLWGSTNWAYVNRLGGGEAKPVTANDISSTELHMVRPNDLPKSSRSSPQKATDGDVNVTPLGSRNASPSSSPEPRRRKASSLPTETPAISKSALASSFEYPNYYPLPLKAQDAQLRILFPLVPMSERAVLVFRALWNPTNAQEFPGRVYVTAKEIYIYSHHLGLVLTTSVSLSSVTEVTAAPGRDCDFLFLHLKEREDGKPETGNRITVKTFLEPLRLLQRRLNFLVRNCNTGQPLGLEDILKKLIKMEVLSPSPSSDQDSWDEEEEEVSASDRLRRKESIQRGKDIRARLRIDQALHDPSHSRPKPVQKFKLPNQPVNYAPRGMQRVPIERVFNVSAKALYHILFGDKSAMFQMLYAERNVRLKKQSPWVSLESGQLTRLLEYQPQGRQRTINDVQIIEVLNDHLCYAVSYRMVPWHLPKGNDFTLLSKIIITHVAKSKCKFSVHTKVEWTRPSTFSRVLVERQALDDLDHHAQDLDEVVIDQVQKLGPHSRTQKAIDIFGHVGQATEASVFPSDAEIPTKGIRRRYSMRQRTIPSLILESCQSILESAASTVVGALLSLLRGIAKICSAHSLLFGVLLVSAAVNFWLSSKDSYEWWKDRAAFSSLQKLGMGTVSSPRAAIYIKDAEELLWNNTASPSSAAEPGKCIQTFTTLSHSSSSVLASSHRIISRLQHTRQSLGEQRHELMVAIRVLNTVEQEVVNAEFENWLYGELKRCGLVANMLKGIDEADEAVDGQLVHWFDDYCANCVQEGARLGIGPDAVITS